MYLNALIFVFLRVTLQLLLQRSIVILVRSSNAAVINYNITRMCFLCQYEYDSVKNIEICKYIVID